jgi:regulator of sigma E protease
MTNFIFAIAAFAAVGLAIGRDLTDYANLPVRVGAVEAGGAGEAGGLKRGDVIKTVAGAPVTTFGAFREAVIASPGQPLSVGVDRNGQALTLTMTPRSESDGAKMVGRLGVGPLVLPEDRNVQPMNPVEALGFGAEQTWRIITLHGDFFAKLASPNPPTDQLSGPIGIFDQTGKVANAAVSGDKDFGGRIGDLALVLLSWAAMLSVAVGIVNLLPSPILDGGHLVFYAVEAVRGRRLSERAQEWSFRAGMVVLLSLFIFATWNDLSRILPRILPF